MRASQGEYISLLSLVMSVASHASLLVSLVINIGVCHFSSSLSMKTMIPIIQAGKVDWLGWLIPSPSPQLWAVGAVQKGSGGNLRAAHTERKD